MQAKKFSSSSGRACKSSFKRRSASVPVTRLLLARATTRSQSTSAGGVPLKQAVSILIEALSAWQESIFQQSHGFIEIRIGQFERSGSRKSVKKRSDRPDRGAAGFCKGFFQHKRHG